MSLLGLGMCPILETPLGCPCAKGACGGLAAGVQCDPGMMTAGFASLYSPYNFGFPLPRE